MRVNVEVFAMTLSAIVGGVMLWTFVRGLWDEARGDAESDASEDDGERFRVKGYVSLIREHQTFGRRHED